MMQIQQESLCGQAVLRLQARPCVSINHARSAANYGGVYVASYVCVRPVSVHGSPGLEPGVLLVGLPRHQCWVIGPDPIEQI